MMRNSSRLARELVWISQSGTDSYCHRNDTYCLTRSGLCYRIDNQTSRRVNVCLRSRHPLQHCSRRIIHTLSIAIQKANSPIIGLPTRIALFVVVAVPLLRVRFVLKGRTRSIPGSPFSHVTHLLLTLLKSSSTSIRHYI